MDFAPKDVTPPKINTNQSPASMRPVQAFRGTRTPQMLEYERQAEERMREQDAMQEEKNRMLDLEVKMQKERERVEQEEYEMRQYYEAEALRHAEDLRLHQEDVKRHQDRVRAHGRMIMDHEASSEAFARVIAMPVVAGSKRQVSFYNLGQRKGSVATNGSSTGSPTGS